MSKFPVITLRGTPKQIGLQHGRQLADRILQTIEYYKTIFNRPEAEILQKAEHFRDLITNNLPRYAEEIEAIAEGCKTNPLWIYALNARSEILSVFVNECTAIYSKPNSLLAQNWDWAEELENLAVIMEIIDETGHEIIMMTEPGIIGKIGLNSSQLGVTLNFLHAPGELLGIPIHILLRALLDCRNFEKGMELVKKYWSGKGGNIIFASSTGNYAGIEFANSNYYIHDSQDVFIHTNHYLSNPELNSLQTKMDNTMARYERSEEMKESITPNFDGLVHILHDQSNADFPICRPYVVDEEIGSVGTITTLIMDLKGGILYYTPGSPIHNKFQSCHINKEA